MLCGVEIGSVQGAMIELLEKKLICPGKPVVRDRYGEVVRSPEEIVKDAENVP